MAKITRLRIQNFRGIKALDVNIGDEGIVAKGGNGKGKTTVLNAIRAAFDAQGIGPDSIRIGSDKAEILVNVDDLSVIRKITKNGSTLSVEDDRGFAVKKPQTYLTNLFGCSSLDPIDFFTAKPKERKAQLLQALPIKVTREQVLGWLKAADSEDVPAVDTTKHGLEVVEDLRKHFYDLRHAQNASVKATEVELQGMAAVAPPEATSVITVDAALSTKAQADSALAGLQARALRVQDAESRTAETRAKATALREQAKAIDVTPPDVDVQAMEQDFVALLRDNEAIRAELAAVQHRLYLSDQQIDVAKARRQSAAMVVTNYNAAVARVGTLIGQAEAIEAALAAGAETAPDASELAAATKAAEDAASVVQSARNAAAWAEYVRKGNALQERVKEEAARAAKLNELVAKFTNEVPAQLLAESDGIPGLQLDGDNILLNGVSLDALSGREALMFTVDVARRLNAKAKFLVVDGLERVDPDHMDAFIDRATADGFQLIGTRVDRGEVVIEHIANDRPFEIAPSKASNGTATVQESAE